MDTLGDMTRTGFKVSGTASDLVELEDAKGLKHLGITFHRKFRDHGSLTRGIDRALAFLEQPDVCDLLEMVDRVPEAGAFIYPTGTVSPLADMLDVLRKMGDVGGNKAGLELCLFVAQILQEAYLKGEPHGLDSHGDLSPWRVVLKSNGQLRIIGFGLPQVDMLMARESDRVTLKEDAYRYCPPERIDGEPEDFSSDLYSLALMAFELMVGEPLFNGSLSEMKQQATNAQGPYRLYQYRDRLPESVIELLTRCLKFDMDSRHADINEFIWEVQDLLALPEVDGPSLVELCDRLSSRLKRRRSAGASSSETSDGEDEPGARALEKSRGDEPEPEEDAGPGQRWGRVSRSGARESRRAPSVARSGSSRKSGRDALRDRLKRSSGRGGPPPSDPKASLKKRLRRSRGREDGPPSRTSKSRDRPLRASQRSDDRRSLRRSRDQQDPQASEPSVARSGRAASLLKRLRSSRGADEAEAEPPKRRRRGASTSTFDVEVDGADPIAVTAAPDGAIAELIAAALEQSGRVAAGKGGATTTWFSAEQGEDLLLSSAPISELDPDESIRLVEEAARTYVVLVEVEGSEAAATPMTICSGLSAADAAATLSRLLGLGEGTWGLSVDGERLHPLQPVGELVTANDKHLVVSK